MEHLNPGVLEKEDILELVRSSPPLVSHYLDLESQLQPHGFDLTLGQLRYFSSRGSLGTGPRQRELASTENLIPNANETFTLEPGPYLVTFNEVVALPHNLMALARPRSTLLRCGVAIHTAVWDAGYQGRSQALLVVHNPQGFILQPNAAVVQMVFFPLHSPVVCGYQGIFQGENLAP